MTRTTRPAQKPEGTAKRHHRSRKTWARRLQEIPARQPRKKTRSDDDADRESRHATRRNKRQKQETKQKPTDRKKPTYRQEIMRKRRNKWCRRNMPTKATNREDKRKNRRRPKATTHCMGRHRTNRIQSTSKKWEGRLEDCLRDMDRELLIFYHRNRQRPEHSLGEKAKQHAHNAAIPIARKISYSCASNYYRRKEPETRKMPEDLDWRLSKGKLGRYTSQNERTHARAPPAKQEIFPTNTSQ